MNIATTKSWSILPKIFSSCYLNMYSLVFHIQHYLNNFALLAINIDSNTVKMDVFWKDWIPQKYFWEFSSLILCKMNSWWLVF